MVRVVEIQMGVLGEGGIYKILYKILYNICIIIGWYMYGIGWKIGFGQCVFC